MIIRLYFLLIAETRTQIPVQLPYKNENIYKEPCAVN